MQLQVLPNGFSTARDAGQMLTDQEKGRASFQEIRESKRIRKSESFDCRE